MTSSHNNLKDILLFVVMQLKIHQSWCVNKEVGMRIPRMEEDASDEDEHTPELDFLGREVG